MNLQSLVKHWEPLIKSIFLHLNKINGFINPHSLYQASPNDKADLRVQFMFPRYASKAELVQSILNNHHRIESCVI